MNDLDQKILLALSDVAASHAAHDWEEREGIEDCYDELLERLQDAVLLVEEALAAERK